MIKRVSLVIFILLCFLQSIAFARESVNIIVLPFEVHAQEKLSYLKTEIPETIKKHLEKYGSNVTGPDIEPAMTALMAEGFSGIREIGVSGNADYVVWGTITWFGQRFSLDAKLMEISAEKSLKAFSKAGSGIENLLTTVNGLSENIVVQIFEKERVIRTLVKGNKRIEAAAIRRAAKTKPGSIFFKKNISEDLKAIYAMGYFEDVRIAAEDGPDGKTLIITVKEKPTVRTVLLKGNDAFDNEDILEVLTVRTGAVLNILTLQKNIPIIEVLYKEKNYHNVRIAYEIHPLEKDQVDVEFIIEEGEKLKIEAISFTGNDVYSSKKLKKMMKTTEKGWLSWFTDSGELNEEDLNQDVHALASFYHNNGYIQAKVGEPQIEYKDDSIKITIGIVEGPRFKVGMVDITGDLVLTREELMEKIKIADEEFYNREVLSKDILLLTDIYADEGYAYAQVSPTIERDYDKLTVDIKITISKGLQVYFEKIIIGGNVKTIDKVIRRQLGVYEQERFNGSRLKRGIGNIYRLDFFDDINVDTPKGSADDKMVVKLDVTEKPTGAFTFGAGYGQTDGVFGSGSVSQRNLFGRGQILSLKGQLGENSTKFDLNFTEPWLFDIPLSAGFDLYNWINEYDTYDKDSMGAGVRLSYPLFPYTRGYIAYGFDISDITNINLDTPQTIKDLSGSNITSKITARLKYDSRNDIFAPTGGILSELTLEYAGLGGDIGFTKIVANVGKYFPFYWNTAFYANAKGGYVVKNSRMKLPTYERFFLGGINSLRGFERTDLSPIEYNDSGVATYVGGDKFVQFNLEFLFPIMNLPGFTGVVFFDTGDTYDTGQSLDMGNLAKSAGIGFRWRSPVGPIRVEYGFILDNAGKRGSGGKYEFTFGSMF